MLEVKEGEKCSLGFFSGTIQLLVVGDGSFTILRKVKDEIHPLTDESGDEVSYSGSGVLFNASLENEGQFCKYYLLCDSGSIKVLTDGLSSKPEVV